MNDEYWSYLPFVSTKPSQAVVLSQMEQPLWQFPAHASTLSPSENHGEIIAQDHGLRKGTMSPLIPQHKMLISSKD